MKDSCNFRTLLRGSTARFMPKTALIRSSYFYLSADTILWIDIYSCEGFESSIRSFSFKSVTFYSARFLALRTTISSLLISCFSFMLCSSLVYMTFTSCSRAHIFSKASFSDSFTFCSSMSLACSILFAKLLGDYSELAYAADC
jgi:hypothetical protein